MSANTPPLPHNEGDTFTNEETGIKYQFSGGAWRAVSSAASEEVAEAIDNIDLEKVLDNGNIADKDIVLTDGLDDLIDISPTEGRIVIASDTDDKTPKLTLAHFSETDESDRKAEIELDQNGTRLDFEMSGDVKDVHFRFGDDEKFIINHEGDAVFTGKVKVQPGTEDNEVVTHSQFAELQEEVESIAPTLERGSWYYSDGENPADAAQIPEAGKYFLIAGRTSEDVDADKNACSVALLECLNADPTDTECNRIYAECDAAVLGEGEVITKKFGQTTALVFANTDDNGVNHTWSTVEVGQHIDVFDTTDDDFLLGIITAITIGENSTRLDVDIVSSQGDDDDTEVRIKIFSVEESVDVTEFVRKSGSTMTGLLSIDKPRAEDSANSFRIKGRIGGVITTLFKDYQRNLTNDKDDYIEYFGANPSPNSIMNKGQIEAKFVKKSGDTMTGALNLQGPTKNGSPILFIQPTTANTENEDLITVRNTSGTSIFLLYNNGDMFTKNEWQPTSGRHVANKAYVDSKVGPGPTKLSWIYKQSNGIPEAGEIRSGKAQPRTGDVITMHRIPHSGIPEFFIREEFTYFQSNSTTGEPLITLWDESNGQYRHKFTASITKIYQNLRGDISVTVGSYVGSNSNLTNNGEIWVSIAGFF